MDKCTFNMASTIDTYIHNFSLSEKRLLFSCIGNNTTISNSNSDAIGDVFVPKLGIVIGEFCVNNILHSTKKS